MVSFFVQAQESVHIAGKLLARFAVNERAICPFACFFMMDQPGNLLLDQRRLRLVVQIDAIHHLWLLKLAQRAQSRLFPRLELR